MYINLLCEPNSVLSVYTNGPWLSEGAVTAIRDSPQNSSTRSLKFMQLYDLLELDVEGEEDRQLILQFQ